MGRIFLLNENVDKAKLSPDMNPLIVVGNKIEQVDRKQEFVNMDILEKKKNFNDKELEILKRDGN